MTEFDGSEGSDTESLAPVIPLFARRTSQPPAASARALAPSHPAFARPRTPSEADGDDGVPDGFGHDVVEPTGRTGRLGVVGAVPDDAGVAEEDPHLAFAEKGLLRKLRTRSLSIREARGVLVGFDLAGSDIDDMIESFEARGYLDDAALAEQLVHAGSARKGQGRQAIAQTMAARGIPRAVADIALADLPDDDLERAVDYARSKAPAMARLEPQAALRRLVGQLTRRGYPSHVAMTAARQALDENTPRRGPFFS